MEVPKEQESFKVNNMETKNKFNLIVDEVHPPNVFFGEKKSTVGKKS